MTGLALWFCGGCGIGITSQNMTVVEGGKPMGCTSCTDLPALTIVEVWPIDRRYSPEYAVLNETPQEETDVRTDSD